MDHGRDYPLWKSSLVFLSLWTDPEYLAYRVARYARRFSGLPSAPRDLGAAVAGARGAPRSRVRSRPDPRIRSLDVDLVYTWVDGRDPAHRAKREHWLRECGLEPAVANPDARYLDDDELRYSLRSAEQFLPWVRRIFIVTDAQVPPWLDSSHPRVTIVDHRDIAGDAAELPTFNSKVIFSWLANIPGLAEHFIVADDDTFFGQRCEPEDFFGRGRSGDAVAMRVMPSQRESDWIVPARQVRDDPLARLWMSGWNNTKLLLERRRPWRRVRRMDLHQAYGITRSDMAITERRYAAEYARVRRSRFRSPGDVHLSALVRYGALMDGRAIPGDLPSRVFRDEAELRGWGSGELPDLFCVNGCADEAGEGGQRELERLFPNPSSFELPERTMSGPSPTATPGGVTVR